MARIRTVKPQLWTEGDYVDLSPQARLMLVAASNFAVCDFGHLPDDPRQLKLQTLPADDVMMVRDDAGGWQLQRLDPFVLVEELVASGRMARIEVDGRRFLHLTRFTDEQKLDKRWTPRCLACQALGPSAGDDGSDRRGDVDVPLPGTSPSLTQTRRSSRKLPDPLPRTGQDRTGPSAAAAAERASAAAAAVDNLPGPVAVLRSKMQAYTALAAIRFDGLAPDRLTAIAQLVELHGDVRLVDVALRTLRSTPPVHVSAFIGTWQALPPPGQRLAVVQSQVCTSHGTQLSPSGVCASCESDRLAADA